MNSVLILGASGFLGQALVLRFLSQGYKVGALSRRPYDSSSNLVKKYYADILNYNEIDPIISIYDIVVNCTGQITSPINQCLIQNTDGIKNIVKSVKQHNKKLLHISSVSVYGSSSCVNEDSQLNPETVYAGIKCFSECIIDAELENYIILRVSNLYGESQSKGVIHYLTKEYLSNNNILRFDNNGELCRFYLDINDLANIINLIVDKGNIYGVFNVIGPCQLTIKELVSKFESILDCRYNVEYQNRSPLENIEKVDNSKISSIIKLNYQGSVDKYIKSIKK
jgi:nucleoside-diphosphate-sugar epimerase